MSKTCSCCYVEKEAHTNNFRTRRYKNGKEFFYSQCRICESAKSKSYNNTNVEKTKKYQKRWRELHPNNKKEYNVKNKERLREYRRKYEKTPEVKIKRNISHHVRRMLKNNKTSKDGVSILSFLPYTMQELKQHLESQFEPWMNWNNWGLYNRSCWDEQDPKTWTWQIDHIMPQFCYPYTSMDDENFRKCWSLENLRPLSAKQNVVDGARRY